MRNLEISETSAFGDRHAELTKATKMESSERTGHGSQGAEISRRARSKLCKATEVK